MMIGAGIKRTAAAARELWFDTDGVILPYVTLMLAVFVGVAALALDGARYMSLQTQLQKAADAAAIAGAAELDRFSTSTDRADTAARTMLANSSVFSGAVTVSETRFLSALPASDATPITAILCTGTACTSAQSIQARFIEVTVTPVTIPTILPIAYLIGGANAVTARASAVAGNDGVNCGLTPMFICNPFEQPGDTYAQATQRLETASASASFKRRLIRLADPGPSGTFGPGDFGYVVPEPGTLPTDSCFPAGAEIGKAMAMDRPLICVRQNGIDLLTGNVNAAKDGLNTRFGLYPSGPLSTAACKAAYPPDVNVRKGWRPQPFNAAGNWCTGSPDGTDSGAGVDWPPGPRFTALDTDTCLIGSNSCTPTANIGADTWNCERYWQAAHPSADYPSHTAPAGCTTAATISRYEVYQYEIAQGYLGDQSVSTLSTVRETGTPQCTGTTGQPNRRILHVAIVNCMSSPVTIQSNAQNVPVAAFGRFFLTHATTNQTKPYAEFLGILQRGDGTIFDQVQLYR